MAAAERDCRMGLGPSGAPVPTALQRGDVPEEHEALPLCKHTLPGQLPHALAHRYPGDPQQVGHLLVGKGDGEQDALRLRPAVLLGQGEQGLGDAGTEVQKAVHGQQAGQHLALAGLHLKDLQGQGGGRLHPAAEHRGRDAEEAALRYRKSWLPPNMAPASPMVIPAETI